MFGDKIIEVWPNGTFDPNAGVYVKEAHYHLLKRDKTHPGMTIDRSSFITPQLVCEQY